MTTTPVHGADDERLRRILWRSRRGLLELDLFLEPFLAECWQTLAQPQRERLEALLECTDPELLEWLSDRQPAPPALQEIVSRIRTHALTRTPDAVSD